MYSGGQTASCVESLALKLETTQIFCETPLYVNSCHYSSSTSPVVC